MLQVGPHVRPHTSFAAVFASTLPITDNFRLELNTQNAGTSLSNQFTLPLIAGEAYNFIAIVDGVDQPPHTTDVSPTYTFAVAGVNTLEIKPVLTITAGFSGVRFNNGGDRLKVLDLSSWGTMLWPTFDAAFYGCANMVISSTDIIPVDPTAITTENMFNGCTSLTTLPAVFDTSNITNADNMLSSCVLLTSLPAYAWDSCSAFDGFLDNVLIEVTSYNSFLIELDANTLTFGTLGGGFSRATAAGLTARENLIIKNWAINDEDGLVVQYNLDGLDANITRFGGDDFRIAPACPEAKGSHLDGLSQYWTSTDAPLLQGIQGAFTIAFWTCAIPNGLNGDLVRYGGGGSGADGFLINSTPSGFLGFFSNNIFSNMGLFANGTNQHIVITYDGTDLRAYYNGVNVFTSTVTMNVFSSNILTLGSNITNRFYKGLLDDFRFYDRVISATEITVLLNSTCDFSPSQITTQAWYDASDITSGNIVESGLAVSQLTDKSGNNKNITQGTGASKPMTETRLLGGMNVLDFDGVDDFLFIADRLGFGTNPDIQIYVIYNSDVTTGNLRLCTIGDGSNHLSAACGDPCSWRHNGGFESYGNASSLTDVVNVWERPFLGDYADDKFYENGAELVGSGGSASSPTNSAAAFTVGADQNGGPATHFNGVMGEMILIESNSISIRQKVEGYLAWRWGLVAVLDGGHPYKTEPPKE
jgi:surface protein